MARVTDVTDYAIEDASSGPGEYVKRVRSSAPATRLTPSLETFLTKWRTPSDKTVGRVSKMLAYGRAISPSPSFHKNMVRLVKGGHIRVCEVAARAPDGSNAHRDAPFADRFYLLSAGACPTEVDPTAATFTGAQRRRRR